MRHYELFRKQMAAILLCFATACGVFTGEAPQKSDMSCQEQPLMGGKKTQAKKNTHLLFSAYDPSASPWQTSIYSLDLAAQDSKCLLSGESGDSVLFHSGDEILFFNRSFDSQNFRRLTTATDKLLAISSQQKFAGGDVGDPHDALYLGEDRVLLAHFTQGKLVVMEQSSGKELDTVQAEWDLPDDVALKPEALLLASIDTKEFVYVVHQALTVKNGSVLANGTQRVFVLENKQGSLIPVDLDPKAPKVQGIKLKGSFPVPVRFAKRDKILLVSMCSHLVSPQENVPGKKCVSAVEEVDPKTNVAEQVWDLKDSGFFMNGPVAPGPDPDIFYANVYQQEGAESFGKKVVRLNLTDHSSKSVYDFSPESGGYWGSFYDETGKAIYIGDMGDDSIGKFVKIKEDGTRKDIALELVPYSGVFIVGQGQ